MQDMLKTLDRYQKCNYGAPEPNVSTREALGSLTICITPAIIGDSNGFRVMHKIHVTLRGMT
ncbi:unnamed protein product [Thlaspi arvense]|uniref:Uncharacterized protein n=1 Tax=Thlaspi arvense TaxID=13288 RepID=A0AAU9RKW3_THLAR|nr:unnamed protein product [Thlaspi arvense]